MKNKVFSQPQRKKGGGNGKPLSPDLNSLMILVNDLRTGNDSCPVSPEVSGKFVHLPEKAS